MIPAKNDAATEFRTTEFPPPIIAVAILGSRLSGRQA